MAADKMSTGPGDERLQIPHDAPLDAPNVGHDRTRLERWQHLLNQSSHLGDGGAQDNYLRPFHRALQIERGQGDRPEPFTFHDAGRAADKTHN